MQLSNKWAIGLSALTLTTASTWAATTNASSASHFTTPADWTRGDADTAYALWDNSFTTTTNNTTVLASDNSNFAAANVLANTPASLSGWNVSNTGANAATTSTQHLFATGAAGGVLNLHVTVPNLNLGSGYSTEFRIQTDSAILAMDGSTFTVSADGGAAALVTPTVTQLFVNGTTEFTTLFDFIVAGNAASYTVNFNSPSSGANFTRTALNALSVDTRAAVPEPASLGALALGGVALLRRKRKQA